MTRVTVVMSAYNAEEYLEESVQSILTQTLEDFEFIIVDDGSTDGSSQILHSFRDQRLVLLRNRTNIGLTRSLNRALRQARGTYIARLDADDVSLPERLRQQAGFLDTRPSVGLVWCPVIYIAPDGGELGVQRVQQGNHYQRLLEAEFCWEHSSVMFRRACLTAVGQYREAFRYAQDYDLWLRIGRRFEIANLPEPLVRLRLHPDAISVTQRRRQRGYVLSACELARDRAEGRRDTGDEPPDRRSGLQLTPSEPTADELGRANLREACVNFLLGNLDQGSRALERAVRADPALLTEPERLARRIVGYGFTHATTADSPAGAVRFLRDLFDHLPPSATELSRLRGKALAHLYATCAFESHRARNPSGVRREVVRAVLHDPTWLTSRGIWSVFLRSLLGVREREAQD